MGNVNKHGGAKKILKKCQEKSQKRHQTVFIKLKNKIKL